MVRREVRIFDHAIHSSILRATFGAPVEIITVNRLTVIGLDILLRRHRHLVDRAELVVDDGRHVSFASARSWFEQFHARPCSNNATRLSTIEWLWAAKRA